MSHYSDIGFDVKNPQDVQKIVDKFCNPNFLERNKEISSAMSWDIQDNTNSVLQLFKFKDLRVFSKINLKEGRLDDFFVGHDNQNISKVSVEKNPIKKTDKNGFPTLNFLSPEEIPFWVTCFNADIFWFDKEEDTADIKLVSYANYIKEIKESSKIEKSLDGGSKIDSNNVISAIQQKDYEMADESYISYFKDDITTSWLSGVIQDFKLLENPISNNKYYAVDIVCIGLKIKLLIDPKIFDSTLLAKGKVICGEFWNTGILVADNHPDYF